MPLTESQKRSMDAHLRSNTIYHWHAFGTDSVSGRGYIINAVQRVMDSAHDYRHDLFLPNCFIDGCSNARFWFKMAAIMCDYAGPEGWHELEFGPPLSPDDRHERYVYTWGFGGDTYRFYTKTLNDGYSKELVWYFGKSVGCGCESTCDGSSEDTDEEEVRLRVYP